MPKSLIQVMPRFASAVRGMKCKSNYSIKLAWEHCLYTLFVVPVTEDPVKQGEDEIGARLGSLNLKEVMKKWVL